MIKQCTNESGVYPFTFGEIVSDLDTLSIRIHVDYTLHKSIAICWDGLYIKNKVLYV